MIDSSKQFQCKKHRGKGDLFVSVLSRASQHGAHKLLVSRCEHISRPQGTLNLDCLLKHVAY